MKKRFVVFALLTPHILMAHPGHGGSEGGDGYTLIHFLTAVEHLIIPGILTLFFLGCWAVFSKRLQPSRNKPNP